MTQVFYWPGETWLDGMKKPGGVLKKVGRQKRVGTRHLPTLFPGRDLPKNLFSFRNFVISSQEWGLSSRKEALRRSKVAVAVK
jgi:hypothetical protein